MARRISVVVSQGQSQNPAKRKMEEDIVAQLLLERGVEVTVVPNLYDLKPDGTGMLCLQGIKGDMVVCSWLFPRAAHWILDRNEIHGHVGTTLLKAAGEDEDEEQDESEEEADASADEKHHVLDERELPNRKIYCLDLRAYNTAQPYVEEILRISTETTTQTVDLMGFINGSPKQEQMDRYLKPTGVEGGPETNGNGQAEPSSDSLPITGTANIVDEQAGRRWYPVIDFSRCTNCMECIDFCLFGVYGVDAAETILVEQPDNCRKGCPACSRVCPENAIIFPQHKTPAIAGSSESADALKIDLSKLFGAPDPGAPGAPDAAEIAARERDEQLLLAGRDAVGMTVGMPKRQANKSDQPKDELDSLMDELDDLDL